MLGNGFSRALRDDIFSYQALFDQADFANLSAQAKQAFADLHTTDFEAVMRACAAPRRDDPGTWISEEFVEVYTLLHRHGFAHSVEAWRDGLLVGGLYGVSIGGAFMGESMFSRETDASKVCLAGLVERLQTRGFVLHDVQFLTPHLHAMGACEIRRADYERRLGAAVAMDCTFGTSEVGESR